MANNRFGGDVEIVGGNVTISGGTVTITGGNVIIEGSGNFIVRTVVLGSSAGYHLVAADDTPIIAGATTTLLKSVRFSYNSLPAAADLIRVIVEVTAGTGSLSLFVNSTEIENKIITETGIFKLEGSLSGITSPCLVGIYGTGVSVSLTEIIVRTI